MKPSIDRPARTFSKARVEQSAIYAYDRVGVWIDRPELPFPESILEDHCTSFVVDLRQAHYQARWKLELRILQPTIECIALLKEALGNDVAVQISYAEIACDLPPTNKRLARLQCDSFMAAAKMLYKPDSVVRSGRTYYFGRRTNGKTRLPRVLAVYADRPSKLLNARPKDGSAPSMHIEARLTGSPSLEQEGIACLNDLIRFDHKAFWERCLRLYQLPKCKTALGRLLATVSGGDPTVSGSALRKRASRWLERHVPVDGGREVFVMHNALRSTPNLAKMLHQISFSEWREEAMSL